MQYVRLELSGKYREVGPQIPIFGGGPKQHFRFDLFFAHVERIRKSRAIKHVLVERKKGFSVPPFGGLEEVRAALERLTRAGKEVWYHAPEYQTYDCVLAAACRHRIMHPLGQVSFPGLALPSVFFKNLLDKQQVEATVIRKGTYKSGADNLRTEKFDKSAREQYQALLDGTVESMKEAATRSAVSGQASGFTPELLDEMIEGRIFTAKEALEKKMVDELRTLEDLINEWKKKKARERPVGVPIFRLGTGKKVVVLAFEGMIIDGSNRRHPLFGQASGDQAMVKTIRSLRKSRRVKAVIFRINSGGGSPTASENILRELAALSEKKPLVISMGPIAGSGGYWISTTGRKLFALPTTITGSIGVLSVYFNLARLLQKHGITTDAIRRGESADMGSALRGLTEKERKTIEGMIDSLYGEFIERVAKFRGLTPEKVDELGQGRIWLGKDAVKHKLVDQTGGLYDAIEYVKEILKAKRVKITFKPKMSLLRRMRGMFSMSSASSGNLLPGSLGGVPEGSNPEKALSNAAAIPADAFREGITFSVLRSCLSVHGQLLLTDPLLFPFLAGKDEDAQD